MNRSCFLCLAACRTRFSAWVTRLRLCVRYVLCCSAFPLVPAPCFRQGPALRSTASVPGRPASFGGFVATMTGSDFSPPFIAGFGSSPSRRGPARHSNRPAGHEISQSLPRRRPGFRRVPSRRDVVVDPGRAIAPRMTVRHMLPSACSDRLGLCDVKDFVAQYTPRRFAVIRFVAPVAGSNATTRYQAGATRYLGPTSTGWTAPAR